MYLFGIQIISSWKQLRAKRFGNNFWPFHSCFWIVVLEKTLDNPLDNKEIHPKGKSILNSHWKDWCWCWISMFDHLMRRADSLEKTLMLRKSESRRRRGKERMKWLDSIINSMDMNLSKLWEIVEDRRAWHATARGVTKSRTWLSDWKTKQYLPKGI